MWEGTARERNRRRTARRRPVSRSCVALAAAALVLTGCSGDGGEPTADPAETPASSSSSSSSSSPSGPSSSPTSTPSPTEPDEPRFRGSGAGKRDFVRYIIDGWGYALQTNDASVLLDASGKKPCRGCDTLRSELRERKKEGWSVDFPGAKVRKVKIRRDGPVEVATATVDIPSSQSFFDDGTLRNDNKARKRVPFLIDIRADGRNKKRRWTLVAFSIK